MKYIKLDNFDQDIACIALGVNKTGSKINATTDSEQKRISFYHEAMDLGVNTFDTAELYGGGYSEEILGKALLGRRSKAIICTKFNAQNSKSDKLQTSLENSLKRLKTDYIDFYIAHWPNPNVPIPELVYTLQQLQLQGKIKAFGISNAVSSEIRKFNSCCKGELFAVENEYNLIEREADEQILPFCSVNKCLFFAYSPLLAGKPITINKEIQLILEKYKCTIHQLYLAWVNRPGRPLISIIRTTNISHLQENIAAMQIALAPEDIETIESYFNVTKETVSLDKIVLDDRSYLNLQDAINNEKDLIPSPQLLSERLQHGLCLPPLKLYKQDGKYRIQDDQYINEVRKYWAHRINNETSIKAYIQ